mgnify:CR=1 FL=1
MFNRGQERSVRNVQTVVTAPFPAPVRGWIRNESLALPKKAGGAEVLENMFPTTEGARVRGGSVKHATIDAAVTHLAVHQEGSTETFFATDADSIYNITTPADAEVAVTADVTGLNGGDWSSEQMTTAAGTFLMMVNGDDDMHQYNGATWYPVDGTDTDLLYYDAETGAFTVGETVTGGTSGATGDIIAIEDDGTTGTLYLKNVSGTFQNDEAITDGDTGAADADIPSGVGDGIKITGVSTSNLSNLWKFKARMFLIEEGTVSAWYLGNLAIGGAATEFPMGGVFRKGGALLFGATWSGDTGDGPDDYCLFFTEDGEVAMYQGTDPSSASTFAIVGVYQIGRPLGKNAWCKSGGDVIILTDDGVVSFSDVVRKERSKATWQALSYPIEEAWRAIASQRGGTTTPFSIALWPSETMLAVGIPTSSGQKELCYVMNTRTGAWAPYTGWDVRDVAVVNDRFYFGTSAGTIMQGETQGSDDGVPYTAVWVPRFEDFRSPAEKEAVACRLKARTNLDFTIQLFANADYDLSIPTPESADASVADNTWGSGVWGTTLWAASDDDTKASLSEWQGVAAIGSALSPGLQITTGRSTKPDIEIIALHLNYVVGEVMG